MAGKSDVVFITTSTFGNRNDMVELDFIVLQMFAAMLACVVIASHDSNFCPEGNVSPHPALLGCLGETLGRINNWTNMAKYRALHLRYDAWNTHRKSLRVELRNPLSENSPLRWIELAAIAEPSTSQTLL